MNRRIILRRLAEQDLADGAGWYDRQRPGLGDELIDEFKQQLQHIVGRPTSFPVIHRDVRRALMERFPFSIQFLVRGSEVVIIAVRHTSRRPDDRRR